MQVELGARDAALVRACAAAAAAGKELQHAGGYAGRTRSFERRLNRLLSAGLIEMTVPDKPRSPVQRYRVTDKGRAAIAPSSNRPRRIDE